MDSNKRVQEAACRYEKGNVFKAVSVTSPAMQGEPIYTLLICVGKEGGRRVYIVSIETTSGGY